MSNTKECTLTDSELTEKVEKWVTDLCHSKGKKWSLRVPADHNHDPDFIFVEAVRRMNRYASRISELEAENKRLREEQAPINMKEKQPSDYQRVLIYDRRNGHWSTGYFEPSQSRIDDWIDDWYTHWMPLPPQPPKEQ